MKLYKTLWVAGLLLSLFSCANSAKKIETTEKINTTNEPEMVIETVEGNANFLVGEFTYFADAAVFKDCFTNKMYSVTPKADIYDESGTYLKLENNYKENAPEAGKPIYVEIQGYQVPKPEGEEGLDMRIVPNTFNIITKDKTPCK